MYYSIGMQKTCPICDQEFLTKDSRQKTCGSVCGNKSRKLYVPSIVVPEVEERPLRPLVNIKDLPPIEDLPAEYVKKAHDFWAGLTGEQDVPRRIG